MSKERSLKWLRARARPALAHPELVEIARSANSPNDAYDQVITETHDAVLAKACYRLRTIKRDYGKKAFEETVSSVTSSSPRSQSTGVEKGAITMNDLRIVQFGGGFDEKSIRIGRRFLFVLPEFPKFPGC